MKKIVYFVLVSILLSSCGNKNLETIDSTGKNNVITITKTGDKQKNNNKKNNISKQETIIKNNSNNVVKNKTDNFVSNNLNTKSNNATNQSYFDVEQIEKLQQKDNQKIENIDTNIKDIGWYKIDCKKQFVTKSGQTQCEKKQLLEAGNGCTFKQLGITLENLDNYFTNKKFDLLDINEIEQYKQVCKENLLEQKKQEEESKKIEQKIKEEQEKIKKQKEEKENKLKQLEQQIKTFKISDCEDIVDKQGVLPPKEILNKLQDNQKQILQKQKQDFIKQCKIGFVLNYKNGDCSLLKEDNLDKQCKQIKKDINIFRKLQYETKTYGGFDLQKVLAPDLYEDNGNLGKVRKDIGPQPIGPIFNGPSSPIKDDLGVGQDNFGGTTGNK